MQTITGNNSDKILQLQPLDQLDLQQINEETFSSAFRPKKDMNVGLKHSNAIDMQCLFNSASSPVPFNDIGSFMASSPRAPHSRSGGITPVNFSPIPTMGNSNHLQHEIRSRDERIEMLERIIRNSSNYQQQLIANQIPSPHPHSPHPQSQFFNPVSTTPTHFDHSLFGPMAGTPNNVTVQPQKYPSSNNFNMNSLPQNIVPDNHHFVPTHGHQFNITPEQSSQSEWLNINLHPQKQHHQQVKTNYPKNRMNFSDNQPGTAGKKDIKMKKKRKYDWDVYQLQDYAEQLLAMMPRTVFSRHREKNNSKSSWYTYNVKSAMYVREQSDGLQSFHVLPPKNLTKDQFYRQFNAKFQDLVNNGKNYAMENQKAPEKKQLEEVEDYVYEKEEVVEGEKKEEENKEVEVLEIPEDVKEEEI